VNWTRPETAKEREARLYEEETGQPPPEPVDDWQLNYRGTREEKARLRAWMGLDTDEDDRGPQPEQEEALF
jgi:hypothetical protein